MFDFNKPQSTRIGSRWTLEEVEQLKKMVHEGKTPDAIAETLGRCDKGVKSKAYSLKLRFWKSK